VIAYLGINPNVNLSQLARVSIRHTVVEKYLCLWIECCRKEMDRALQFFPRGATLIVILFALIN